MGIVGAWNSLKESLLFKREVKEINKVIATGGEVITRVQDIIESTGKVFSLGEEVGDGGIQGSVFLLEKDDNFVCKVIHRESYQELEDEYLIGSFFHNNGISTPKYGGIHKVDFNGKETDGLIMEHIRDGYLIKDNIDVGGSARTINDTTSLDYIRGKELLNVEKEKIRNLGIDFSPKGQWGLDLQGLYVPEEDKVYLIDFGEISFGDKTKEFLLKDLEDNKLTHRKDESLNTQKEMVSMEVMEILKLISPGKKDHDIYGLLEGTLENCHISGKDKLIVVNGFRGQTLKDITKILINSDIDEDYKINLIENVTGDVFYKDLTIIANYYEYQSGWKHFVHLFQMFSNNIENSEFILFLSNEDFGRQERIQLIQSTDKNFSLQESEDFVKNDSIDYDLRAALVKKITSDGVVEDVIDFFSRLKESLDSTVSDALISIIKGKVQFEQIKVCLLDKKMPLLLKGELVGCIKSFDEEEVIGYLDQEGVEKRVKLIILDKMNIHLTFEKVRQKLEDKGNDDSFKRAVILKLSNVDFSEIKYFFENKGKYFSESLLFDLSQKIKEGTNVEDIRPFIKNNELSAALSINLASSLKTGFSTDEALDFIYSGKYPIELSTVISEKSFQGAQFDIMMDFLMDKDIDYRIKCALGKVLKKDILFDQAFIEFITDGTIDSKLRLTVLDKLENGIKFQKLARIFNNGDLPIGILLLFIEKLTEVNSVEDLFYIILNRDISVDVVLGLINKISSEFDILPVLESFEDRLVSEDVIIALIKKSGSYVGFDSLLPILKKGSIKGVILCELAKKCEEGVDFWDMEELLRDKYYIQDFAKIMLSKVTKKYELRELNVLLANQELPGDLRCLITDILSHDLLLDDSLVRKFILSSKVSNDVICGVAKHVKVNSSSKYFKRVVGNRKLDNSIKSILLEQLPKNYHNVGMLNDVENYLFNVPIVGSSVSKDLIINMKKEPEKDVSDIMREEINQLFYNILGESEVYEDDLRIYNGKKVIEKQVKKMSDEDIEEAEELGLNSGVLDLSMYLRYGHQVDYPEISEYILLFVQKYIKEGYSRYFSNMRLIPYAGDRYFTDGEFLFPDEAMIDEEVVKKYEVNGREFDLALHAYSIPLFLSHSSNSKPYGTPNIITDGMKDYSVGDVSSRIELERRCMSDNFAVESSLEDILKEVLSNFRDLERKLSG